MFCAQICVQVSFMFHWDGIDLQATYDEQQRMYELTFINSAFPSKFFACKQAKCFHEFVVEVLPVNYSHCSSQYYATQHCYVCRLSLVSLCFYLDSGRAFNDVSYCVRYHSWLVTLRGKLSDVARRGWYHSTWEKEKKRRVVLSLIVLSITIVSPTSRHGLKVTGFSELYASSKNWRKSNVFAAPSTVFM